MGNFKYKIKEETQTLKVKDVDPTLIDRLEKQYGPVDKENDFFSSDLKTYFKTKDINPETGAINHQVIKLASFADSLDKLNIAVNALSELVKSPSGKDDAVVVKIYDNLKGVFNNYRTHLRKYYPDQYLAIKDKLDEISTISSNSGFVSGGEGENYATPKAFGKVPKSNYSAYTEAGWKKVNEFKYKLAKTPIKEAEDVDQFLDDMQINDPARRKFISSRLMGFDAIEDKLNQLVPLMQQAKNKTIDYYRNNPESYAVVYGTDLAQEYLDDIIQLFKQ